MNYADAVNKICEIDNQIQNLKNEKFFLKEFERIYSYIERSNILGKCYKMGDSYYKVVDLEVNNHYRCIALHLNVANSNVDFPNWIESSYRHRHDSIDYNYMGISITSIMIEGLNSMEEISEEEFKGKYSEKMLKFLNIDKILKEKRFQDIENFKKEGCLCHEFS